MRQQLHTPSSDSLTSQTTTTDDTASSPIVIPEDRSPGDLGTMLDSALAESATPDAQVWILAADDGDDDVAAERGLIPYRDLWQLRCRLPIAESSDLITGSFSEADIHEFVDVNNRAFHWHPEQGNITVEAIRSRMAEPWFKADGFRIYRHSGHLTSFCWTKIHNDTSPPMGEVYVMAVDPDFTGRGLGHQITLAGLDWLTAQGLEIGMLYVESDNHAANAIYSRIGFTHHQIDRVYKRRIE